MIDRHLGRPMTENSVERAQTFINYTNTSW